jgi:hypothetical protein
MKSLSVFCALALAGFAAAPASADILIYLDQPGVVQPNENVEFQVEDVPGNPIHGITNQSNTLVTFNGMEYLVAPSSGQSRIEAADGGLDWLKFHLTDPRLLFGKVEFDIHYGQDATATEAFVQFEDRFGNIFSDTMTLGNGSNWVSAEAINGQLIRNVTISLNGDVGDIRQFRLGPVAEVPEPTTWAMLIAGFGLVGAAARQRKATRASA